MTRSRLQNQLAFPLLIAALAALAWGALYPFGDDARARANTGLSVANGYDIALNSAKFAFYVALAFILVRLVAAFFFGFLYRWRRGYEAPNLIRNVFSIVTYTTICALLITVFYPTIQLGALFTTSAIFGVIIGLALQDTLGNLFAGISLHADKPFQVGDVVAVGKWSGVVESIAWRAVKLRTFANHLVVVSNSNLAREAIEVFPRNNLNARIVTFNAPYTDSPAQTIEVVREAVREAENVSTQITPIVRIRSLKESGVEYEIKYWPIDYARYNDTDALVRELIWYSFRRARLEFASPTLTLKVDRTRNADSATSKDSEQFIERLNSVDIFSPLAPEEISKLARAVTSHIFAPGETLIHAGEEGSSMYIVHRGRVEVRVNGSGDGNKGVAERTVAELGAGAFFGEMALLTGERRTANVVAAGETEVLEINHEAMQLLFTNNPELVKSLSRVVGERRSQLAVQSEISKTVEEESDGILAAVKRFFHL